MCLLMRETGCCMCPVAYALGEQVTSGGAVHHILLRLPHAENHVKYNENPK